MSKESKRNKRIGELSEADMRVWAEWLATGQVHDKNHQKQLERLSKRSVSLSDVTTIVEFMGKRNDGYISSLIEQQAVFDNLLTKLGVTEENRLEAKAEYEKELNAIQEKIQKELESIKENNEK
ncbi:hypothetical protein vBEfaHEF1TV_124 [Enterococcus phage vB_EfaH_EF1TV]|nr:hypothetical protein vBEfaHEF1TV_124 [Enterococcus phage vB_EfaH_EF1TV]DAG89488.1 MAG TPA: hypothetical protein [Herelleviridae sp.]